MQQSGQTDTKPNSDRPDGIQSPINQTSDLASRTGSAVRPDSSYNTKQNPKGKRTFVLIGLLTCIGIIIALVRLIWNQWYPAFQPLVVQPLVISSPISGT